MMSARILTNVNIVKKNSDKCQYVAALSPGRVPRRCLVSRSRRVRRAKLTLDHWSTDVGGRSRPAAGIAVSGGVIQVRMRKFRHWEDD
jgi:hypothetical protein